MSGEVRSVYRRLVDLVDGSRQKRVAWGILVGMSSMALCTYNPALAQDQQKPADDGADDGQIPRDQNQPTPLRGKASVAQAPREPARAPHWGAQYQRRHHATLRLAARDVPQGTSTQFFEIPAGDLQSALLSFSRQVNLQLLYPSELTSGLRTKGVRGTYMPEEALRRLLAGTGLGYRYSDSNTVTLISDPAQVADGLPPAQPQENDGPKDPSGTEGGEGKPVKVPEVVIKETHELPPPSEDPVSGYKADVASTTTRSALPIVETPSSIGVVTKDIIRDTVSLRRSDAFEAVSGVSRGNRLFGGGEGLNIRGFNTHFTFGSFSGMKQNGLATDGAWEPDPALIERYEIVKSPTSIVGGAANPGGIVNRITKKPLGVNFAQVTGQGGSFGLARGVIDANGVLPQNQDVRGRLIFAVEDGGNFVDDVEVREYTVAPSVEWLLFGGSGRLLLTGRYLQFDGSSYPGFPLLSNGEVPDIPRTRNFGGGSPNGAFTEFEGHNSEIHYEHQFINDLTFNARAKYEHSDLSNLDIYGFAFGGIDPATGNSPIYAGLREHEWDTFSGEIFLSKGFELFGHSHELLAGVDHRDQTNDFLFRYNYPPFGVDNIFDPANNFQATPALVADFRANPAFLQRTELRQTGVFFQGVFRPFERLTLVAAGRHDWADITFTNRLTGDVNDNDPTKLTGRVGATYALFPWMHVYTGYQESFDVQTAVTVENQLLPPETGQNVEVGAKLSLLDDRVLITTALFRTYRQNVATADPANPGFSIAAAEQRHQGVEFDVNGRPLPGLNVNLAFSYIDAEVTKTNTSSTFIVEGRSPSRIQRSYVGRVFATYELQEGPLQGFGFGGGVFFHSGFVVDALTLTVTDPYQRVDALVFYRPSPTYELAINVRNLTDATYIESPGSIFGFNQFGAPVSVFGTLRINFSPDMDWTPW